MSQVVLSFLGYLILQLIVTVIGLNVVRLNEIYATDVLKSWVFGQIILFGILQLLAVPLILTKMQFGVLFWIFCISCLLLFSFGLRRLIKGRIKHVINIQIMRPLAFLLIMIIILPYFWQASTYIFGVHLDEDDTRFLAQTNDALEYGQMLTRNFDTGEYLGHVEPIRDITSPWIMFLAITSRLLFTKPTIFAHTIFPPMALGL